MEFMEGLNPIDHEHPKNRRTLVKLDSNFESTHFWFWYKLRK